MQSISFDILNETAPIKRGTKSLGLLNRLKLWFLDRLEKLIISNTEKHIDKLILLCEGMMNHLKDLNNEETKEFYNDVQKVIVSMDTIDEVISEFSYLEKKELQKKMQISLKLLYKLEAKLEVKISKSHDSDQSETGDSDVRKAISQIGLQSIAKTLDKYNV